MNVIFHNRFDKMIGKLSPKLKTQAMERLALFCKDPLNSTLRNHALNTPYKDGYSINITGDYRAIYYLADNQTAMFTHIGTHSQLYK